MQASAWIAVVDDDPSVSIALTRVLSICGLQAKAYASADEFIAAISEGLPACLIVDVQMPGMTGLELLDYLRLREIFIPSIVITAREDPTLRERCADAGAVAFFIKPWRNASLLAAIDKALKIPPRGASQQIMD